MYKEGNVTVMVADMGRAVRFYSETLGLPLAAQHGDAWAEIRAPGLVIGLHPLGDQPLNPDPNGRLSIGLHVDDLDAVVAGLAERGVSFAGPIAEGGYTRLAYFTDPDDNPLYLWEAGQAQHH